MRVGHLLLFGFVRKSATVQPPKDGRSKPNLCPTAERCIHRSRVHLLCVHIASHAWFLVINRVACSNNYIMLEIRANLRVGGAGSETLGLPSVQCRRDRLLSSSARGCVVASSIFVMIIPISLICPSLGMATVYQV